MRISQEDDVTSVLMNKFAYELLLDVSHSGILGTVSVSNCLLDT